MHVDENVLTLRRQGLEDRAVAHHLWVDSAAHCVDRVHFTFIRVGHDPVMIVHQESSVLVDDIGCLGLTLFLQGQEGRLDIRMNVYQRPPNQEPLRIIAAAVGVRLDCAHDAVAGINQLHVERKLHNPSLPSPDAQHVEFLQRLQLLCRQAGIAGGQGCGGHHNKLPTLSLDEQHLLEEGHHPQRDAQRLLLNLRI